MLNDPALLFVKQEFEKSRNRPMIGLLLDEECATSTPKVSHVFAGSRAANFGIQPGDTVSSIITIDEKGRHEIDDYAGIAQVLNNRVKTNIKSMTIRCHYSLESHTISM